MEVSGQLHAPAALSPGKSPLDSGLGGPHIQFERGGNDRKYLPYLYRKPNSSHPASSLVTIRTEIRIKSNSGSACNHSFQFLSFCLFPENFKIKIQKRTIILPVVLYACETWSLTLWEEHRWVGGGGGV